MKVEKVNFTVGGSNSEVTLFSDEQEIRSKNIFSILIGKNGTLKSSTLKVISDSYRKTRKTKGEIDQPGVFIPLPRLVLHGKLLPIWSTGFWNGGLVS